MAAKNASHADRHASTASSGADSWTSQETIKGLFGSRRHTPVKISTDKALRGETEISPGSLPELPLPPPPQRPSRHAPIPPAIAPWETQHPTDGDRYRRDSNATDTGGTSRPPTQPQHHHWYAPSAHGHNHAKRNGASSNPFSSFYDDSSEEMARTSPGFRPGSSQEDVLANYSNAEPAGDRRPSVASATTISSIGSKSSIGRGFHKKKLNTFFGDDFPGLEAVSRQNSESSLPPTAIVGSTTQHPGYAASGSGSASGSIGHQNNSTGLRARNDSLSIVTPAHGLLAPHSRPSSPSNIALARPKTPHTSEVTPWEFQPDPTDPPLPLPPGQAPPSRSGAQKAPLTITHPHHHHNILHFPVHKHTRSREEDRSIAEIPPHVLPLRPTISREESTSSFRRPSEFPVPISSKASASNLRSNLPPRPPSPTPSSHSLGMSSKSPHSKWAIFDRLRRKDREPPPADQLRDLPGSSLSLQNSRMKAQRTDTMGSAHRKRGFPETVPRVVATNSKDPKGRLPFKSSKKPEGTPQGRDPNHVNPNESSSNAMYILDTDFSDMSDIINVRRQIAVPMASDIFTGLEQDERYHAGELKQPEVTGGVWDAPDSWAVKRPGDENMGRMRELDENGNLLEENTGPPFCLRVFRSDSTFAVLSVPLNTTVADIIGLIRKKSCLQNDLDNYLIVMRKHDISRQLERNERPLVIQKKLLEQAGYIENDKIEDVGRDDNSYLCRFTFLPQKSAGYASLERDPELDKLGKFSHIDLQARNLITIPVALHKRATEIISLNLSRNLAVEIPKDFIQACSNLREIKFTGNEAWKVPPSFSQAARLTMLDISNNRLEQLEHAELDKLQHLVSLRLSNNRLTSLPNSFGRFKHLRSLNISSNSLTKFPDSLGDLSSLVDLDISFNSISSMGSIAKLATVERLWATNNLLSGAFPEDISNMMKLKEVDIRHNAIDNIDMLCRLPNLEYLFIGYNHVSNFQGAFHNIALLHLNNNPITRFDFTDSIPSLKSLDLAKAKLAALPDDLFRKIPNLTKLILDKNHFVSISPNIGMLTRLEHLSIAQNAMSSLPPEIGRLGELRYLDLRENNLNTLPPQIWFAKKLETLNLSSNVLSSFPKPGAPLPALPEESLGSGGEFNHAILGEDELGRLGALGLRRPSEVSGGNLSGGSSSPGPQSRKGSVASQLAINRKPSMVSRGSESTIATFATMTRKDSSLSTRLSATFATSMRHLYLADNRLQDEVFDELALLPELRVLNLSYNILYDLPPRRLSRWTHLDELYLSGNELRSLPAEDLDEIISLRVLHINCNKFQVLPAELAKVQKLAIMDVGSNSLKYNVSNWPYDWNWNWNPHLKYLNMSGNTRLEIKHGNLPKGGRPEKDLTDFSALPKLRVLGLMDVTLRSTVPDQTEDRRVRTAGSQIAGGLVSYGMADSLGRNDHLSTMDMVVDRFRSHDDEVLIGLFDGQALPDGGSRISKYLYEHFKHKFSEELDQLRKPETALDALRRTYLSLNKEIAIAAMQTPEQRRDVPVNAARFVPVIPDLGESDITSGCVATVLFIKEMTLFISNVGDATALLVDSEGNHKVITRKHDPTEPSERQRIRDAGGYVSRNGKLNDALSVSRAFGYIQHSPSVIAAPYCSQVNITESHEMIILASRELWAYMSRDFAVDLARSERGDPMRAAQKLRDLAIAFGASAKIMVMIVGVDNLKKRERLQIRTPGMSMMPTALTDEFTPIRAGGRRNKDAPNDSKLARLTPEVEPPVGQLSIVFTDIKNSTLLWGSYESEMRAAIKMHNDLMRRQLRLIGGYEVKTEGDSFMVSFPTVTSALLWAFIVQIQLLEVQWPNEILNCVHGAERCDSDGNIVFRGLSVRMGIHWGTPVCEVDPVTKRMDYFGPMVNRSSRISSVADGGQICVSNDFIAEIQRLFETNFDMDRSGSFDSSEDASMASAVAMLGATGAGAAGGEDYMTQLIRRELRSLSSQGFEVKEKGLVPLKGLENPEHIFLIYPHALAGRFALQQQRIEAGLHAGGEHRPRGTEDDDLAVDVDNVWDLYRIALRLENLCSLLENPETQELITPERAFLERIREGGGEVSDRFLLNILGNEIARIESCINTLALRNMVRPFGAPGSACVPMADIFSELAGQLGELKALKAGKAAGAVSPPPGGGAPLMITA